MRSLNCVPAARHQRLRANVPQRRKKVRIGLIGNSGRQQRRRRSNPALHASRILRDLWHPDRVCCPEKLVRDENGINKNLKRRQQRVCLFPVLIDPQPARLDGYGYGEWLGSGSFDETVF